MNKLANFVKQWYLKEATIAFVGLVMVIAGKISNHWWNVLFGTILVVWGILLAVLEYTNRPKQ